MLAYIKAFFAFLLPIVRTAAVQAAADELARAAYPERRPSRTSYNRYSRPGYRRLDDRYAARIPRIRDYAEKDAEETTGSGFHDVLMVAFDISGPSRTVVEAFINNHMPSVEEEHPTGVNLDSWWIADDDRLEHGDCDSAVFVKKGCQEEARELLRKQSLVD